MVRRWRPNVRDEFVTVIVVACTHKVGTAEAVPDGDALLVIGKDFAILNLLDDDRVLVLDIIVRDTAVDLLHNLFGLFMVAPLRVEAEGLGDEDEDNDSETHEGPH
jgi:hypothetical protein